MKLSEALTTIQRLYDWDLSKSQKQVFLGLMRATQNPQQVIDNWAIYRKDFPFKSPRSFGEWFKANINIEHTEKQTEFPTMKWNKEKR